MPFSERKRERCPSPRGLRSLSSGESFVLYFSHTSCRNGLGDFSSFNDSGCIIQVHYYRIGLLFFTIRLHFITKILQKEIEQIEFLLPFSHKMVYNQCINI